MRERLKTGILFVLVVSSIVLTGRLLFGVPALETAAPPAYEELQFGDLRPLTEIALPHLRMGADTSWQVLAPWETGHADAWGMILDLIRFADLPRPAEPAEVPEHDDEEEEEQAEAPESEISVHAVFTNPAQVGWWLPNAAPADLYLTEVAWYSDNPLTLWFRDPDGYWHTSVLARLPQHWDEQLPASFAAAASHTYYGPEAWEPLVLHPEAMLLLPDRLPLLAPFSLKAEEMDWEKLLRSIFVNTALVRRIEERDGAVIYTDGQDGLRIFDHGEIEYTSPKSEPGLEQMTSSQALRRAAQYLQLMGGWPDDLYLTDYTAQDRTVWNMRQGETYTLTFVTVQRGTPLLCPEPPVYLRFSDRGVINYRRHRALLDSPAGAAEMMISPLKSAAMVAHNLETAGIEAALTSVTYAYYTGIRPMARATAVPVWVFAFDNGHSVLVHGHSGELILSNP